MLKVGEREEKRERERERERLCRMKFSANSENSMTSGAYLAFYEIPVLSPSQKKLSRQKSELCEISKNVCENLENTSGNFAEHSTLPQLREHQRNSQIQVACSSSLQMLEVRYYSPLQMLQVA